MNDPDALIDKCYAAALEPERWPTLMNDISEHFDASGTGIVSHDLLRTSSTLHSDSRLKPSPGEATTCVQLRSILSTLSVRRQSELAGPVSRLDAISRARA